MKEFLKASSRKVLHKLGVDVVRFQDFDEQTIRIYKSVRDLIATGPERVYALIQAVKYVVNNEIEGAMVECGVFKGGSVMVMAKALQELGCSDRDIYLYDTFSGMTAPSEIDVSYHRKTASKRFAKAKIAEDSSDWCFASIEDVMNNVYSTGYSKSRFRFIKGKVEDTIPHTVPEKISLLRLDTDWYQSTKHELVHLFPLLSTKGVIIIDDYGHWHGARKAVDEYIAENHTSILLHRIDYACRAGVKTE